tara:strand:+ start:3343 stop:4914 length:1572 start_codon:yes stop_codon:yes gene_type:complete
MAVGTYVLAVDWNNDGDFSDSGENITARTMKVEWKRGNDYASQLVGKAVAGTLNATLNNVSGDYSTFNTSSPLTGNLLPGRKVKLTGNDGTTTRTLWQGFLESIQPIPSAKGANLARLTAIGPLGYLNKFEVSTAMFVSKKAGELIGEILDVAGWDDDDRDLDTGIVEFPRFWCERTKTLKALRLVEETETGLLEESPDGKIVYRDRHARSTDTKSVASQATYSDASAAALAYSHISQIDPLKFIYNELRAKLQLHSGAWVLGESSLGVQTELASDPAVLWTYPETGSNSPSIDAGATRTFVAQYPSSGSANTARAVDFWQNLTATTDYLANDSADGTGTNRTANISVTLTKRAQSMDIALENGHSSTVYITKLQAQGNPVEAKDNFEVVASDSTSQTTFGKRTYPHPGKFVPSASEAQDWADFHVQAWKEPVPLLKLTLVGNRSTATLTDIMTRDISDLVTVTANNDTGLGINEGFFVEAVHHQLDAGLNHRATMTLSQSSGYAGFWVLGSSSLDNATRLAY